MLLCIHSAAQHFGGHPAGMKWYQINTDSIRIIFPQGVERQAQSIAGYVHALPFLSGKSIGTRVRKFDIVLQTHSTISNGYVSLGPRRSEFQLTPLQNSFQLGSIPWHQSLALHEYRHIQQYNNFRKGVSKAFYYLFGQQGQELANNAAIPNWFWEGDAVLQETLWSTQGRGRLPHFFNGFRALQAAGKSYGWMKIRNGSLRDYTPDHYQLGYQLVAYGREKYGEAFWQKVTDDAVRFRGLFYPFQRAVKKHSGVSFNKFRNDALAHFRNTPYEMAPGAMAAGQPDPANTLAKNAWHFIADEEFPQWIDSVNVVYAHSSYKRNPSFRIRNLADSRERIIRMRDLTIDPHFSYNNGRIVYAAYEPDTRWGWRDYSDIRLIDVASGNQESITHHEKYFSPDINLSGDKVVAVHAKRDGTNALHVLWIGRREGQKMLAHDEITAYELPNTAGYIYTYPKFFMDDQVAVAARDSSGKMAIALVHLGNGTSEIISPWVMGVLGFVNIKGDSIFFTASHENLDRLFCIVGNKIWLIRPDLPNDVTGSYQPSAKGNKVAWTEFTAAGLQLRTQDMDSLHFAAMTFSEFSNHFPDTLAMEQQPGLSSGNRSFPVSRYRTTFSLVNFHSWRPTIDDPEYTFSLLSENTMNNLQGELYLRYNRNEQSKEVGMMATFGGWFPWIRVGTNYTFDRQASFRGARIFWNEWEARTGLVVPLNWTGGKNYRNFSIGSDVVLNKAFYKGVWKDSFRTQPFVYLNTQINFSNQLQKSRQHIHPRWAQTAIVRYAHGLSLQGQQFMASADWYLPGIALTHNLVINTAFHVRDTMNTIRFSNAFPFSRGYVGFNFKTMLKTGAEYHFPMVYPDWGFASLVYFQRIRADIFYDHTNVMDYTSTGVLFTDNYRSFGTEIFFDTKWWNQEPVSFGIRYARLLDGGKQNLGNNQWELILPVNLFRD